MAIFKVYTSVHRGMESVYFAPGDEVPDWAVGLVGLHCLEGENEQETEVETPADPEADAEDPAEPAEDAEPLNFTEPAKPKATRGRPPKRP